VLPSHAPAHAMYEFKQCALSRTPRPPHPHCGHTHVPPFSPQSPHPSHVQHRPLFRCGDSTVLSAVPLPQPAAHPLAAAHASAVAPAASLDPLRPRAPNGQRMARHRCSTARHGSQHRLRDVPFLGPLPTHWPLPTDQVKGVQEQLKAVATAKASVPKPNPTARPNPRPCPIPGLAVNRSDPAPKPNPIPK